MHGKMYLMYKVGKNSKIIANHIDIHDSVEIGDNVHIHCDTINIGKFSKIGNDVKINCKSLEIGSWLFMWDRVEIGRGGSYGPNSNVKIGNHVGIFENTIINPSESVEIGDDVGIGGEVMIWTHGAWLDVLQGFPADFGPVKIGNSVWLPARSIVLPNVTIGDNVVIGINSIINRDLPSGCFAAGSPCKVIKEDCYPREVSENERKELIEEILSDWKVLIQDKGYHNTNTKYENGIIELMEMFEDAGYTSVKFDLNNRNVDDSTDLSEDLRDYLRRRGIKIYTDKHFKSIEPKFLKEL